jgi:hypothetical protein
MVDGKDREALSPASEYRFFWKKWSLKAGEVPSMCSHTVAQQQY